MKRVKEVLGTTIDDLKRQLQAMKYVDTAGVDVFVLYSYLCICTLSLRPYKGVIAERQIRRLKSQVKQGLMKSLQGRPRGKLENGPLDEEKFEEVDFDYGDQPHERRLCRVQARSKQYGEGDVTRVSQEKLLEASLQSLDMMSRRLTQSVRDNVAQDRDLDLSSGDYVKSAGGGESGSGGVYPSASYLRGALWLGRNLTLVSEELAEQLDKYRTRYLHEVSEAGNDPDARRACHRLALLAGSGINHCCTLTAKSRDTTRDILQVRMKLSYDFSCLLPNA